MFYYNPSLRKLPISHFLAGI
ncbi:MAG: hypothetical protein KGV46_00075 [Pasteurella sp.]|nr:hypothetical protein [Pasteurella sp.]